VEKMDDVVGKKKDAIVLRESGSLYNMLFWDVSDVCILAISRMDD
jgi:hypothetical protein